MGKASLWEAFRFALVGGIGFIIDAGLLFVFTRLLELDPYLWRLFSFLSASVVTWALHRYYTFKFVASDPVRQWMRFAVFNGIGGALNFMIYSLLLLFGDVPLNDPMVAIVISSIIAYIYNFTVSKFLVFSHA